MPQLGYLHGALSVDFDINLTSHRIICRNLSHYMSPPVIIHFASGLFDRSRRLVVDYDQVLAVDKVARFRQYFLLRITCLISIEVLH